MWLPVDAGPKEVVDGRDARAEDRKRGSDICADKHLIQSCPSEVPKPRTSAKGGSSGSEIVSMWTCERECILLEGKKEQSRLVSQSTSERDGYQG